MITVVGMFKSLGGISKKTPKGLAFLEYQLEPFGGEGSIKATSFNPKHKFPKGTVVFVSGELQTKAWSKGDRSTTYYNISIKTMEDINAESGKVISQAKKIMNVEDEAPEEVPF